MHSSRPSFPSGRQARRVLRGPANSSVPPPSTRQLSTRLEQVGTSFERDAQELAANQDLIEDALFKLREEVGELIDLEKAVIRLEVKLRAQELKRSSMRIGAAIVLCCLGGLGLVTTVALLLGSLMPMWLAVLLVSAALLVPGVYLGLHSVPFKLVMPFAPELEDTLPEEQEPAEPVDDNDAPPLGTPVPPLTPKT